MGRRKKTIKRKKSPLRQAGMVGMTAGRWLLEFLGAMIDLMPTIETPYAYARRLDGWPDYVARHRIDQEVRRLKDRGWIEEAEREGKKFIKLTEQGKLEMLYRKLAQCSTASNCVWDGRWWMALFDIPEKGRKERDAIREALRKTGFCRLQKSVYVYPYEIPNELTLYLAQAKLLPFIRFVRAEHMDDVNVLKKHYRLGK